MTCLVLIITSVLIILAADDAVTLENRIYQGIEKIYELSNDPPISVMIYGNSDFCEIPLENIISEFKKKTDFKKINTVLKVKKEFLNFNNNILQVETVENYLKKELKKFKEEINDNLNEMDIHHLTKQKERIQKFKCFEKYQLDFEDVLPKNLTSNEIEILKNNLEHIFFENLNEKRSGIVISGIDKQSMKSSYTQFEMILNTANNVIFENMSEEIDVSGSKIKIFAQNQVIESFLNGIDEELQDEITNNLPNYIEKTLDYLLKIMKEKRILSKNEYDQMKMKLILLKEIL